MLSTDKCFYNDMSMYFHFAPILLAPGSIIEPGNFGRIIRSQGESHPLYRREMEYEAMRLQMYPDRPSRFECLFCFPTLEEAEICRRHINGYQNSVLYEVESAEENLHIADANNAIQHFSLSTFDPNIIAYYWRGEPFA